MIPEEHEQPNDKGHDMKLVESAERMLRIINRIIKELKDADATTTEASVGYIELKQDANWRFTVRCAGHAVMEGIDLLEVMTMFHEHLKMLKIEKRAGKLAEEFDMMCVIMPAYDNNTRDISYALAFTYGEQATTVYIKEGGKMKLTYAETHKALRHIKKLANDAEAHNAMREAKGTTLH